MEKDQQVVFEIRLKLISDSLRMAVQVLGEEKGSEYVALNCYEGIRTQDEILEEALKRLVLNSENIVLAAKELATVSFQIQVTILK